MIAIHFLNVLRIAAWQHFKAWVQGIRFEYSHRDRACGLLKACWVEARFRAGVAE